MLLVMALSSISAAVSVDVCEPWYAGRQPDAPSATPHINAVSSIAFMARPLCKRRAGRTPSGSIRARLNHFHIFEMIIIIILFVSQVSRTHRGAGRSQAILRKLL